MTELEMILEGWERNRAVTLQFLDALAEEESAWRPTPQAMTCGQQLLHIAQNEDFHERGLFAGEWNRELLRFPVPMPSKEVLGAYFGEVRARTAARFAALAPADLDAPCDHPNAPPGLPLRWWLTLLLEHEVHHRGQLAVYLRQMGKLAPFFAMPLPPGHRPDIQARRDMGGV
jgi:uncharacterized damage-inducible protein DinB